MSGMCMQFYITRKKNDDKAVFNSLPTSVVC